MRRSLTQSEPFRYSSEYGTQNVAEMTEPVSDSVGKAALGSMSVRESFLSRVASPESAAVAASPNAKGVGGTSTPSMFALSTAGKYDDLAPWLYSARLMPGVTGTSVTVDRRHKGVGLSSGVSPGGPALRDIVGESEVFGSGED
jgi:hypothetical protein